MSALSWRRPQRRVHGRRQTRVINSDTSQRVWILPGNTVSQSTPVIQLITSNIQHVEAGH